MNTPAAHQPEKRRERNCVLYAMNESLFGQSYAQLNNMEQEMDIHLNIDFSCCYLILTGLPRRFYMERLGMGRSHLLGQVNRLREELGRIARSQGFACEIAVLNYDYSKRILVVISPGDEFDILPLAEHVGAFLEEDYTRLWPNKPPETHNITVYSGRANSYEAYQQAFAHLQALYERAFFLREHSVFGAQLAQRVQIPTSMVEVERELAEFSDRLFLRDAQGTRELLHSLLLEQLKHSQDRRLCAEVMILLKKRIDDLCLILGLSGTLKVTEAFDMDRFFSIEELYDSVLTLVTRLLSESTLPPLHPDGLPVRAARFIRKQYYNPIDLTAVADHLHVNPSYLSHIFKREMGIGLTRYITRIRIEQAQQLLKETDWKIARVAQSVGLNDPRYFNTLFKRYTGVTPAAYRDRATSLPQGRDPGSGN